MFDEVEIVMKAGTGGDGSVSFHREKYVPFGGPDGGDGGNGGNVALVADSSVTSLRVFQRKRRYGAADGEKGRGQKKHGKDGEDLVLRVPVGTIVLDKERTRSEALIADLEQPGQQAVVASGGRGGLGNTHYATSTNQAPRIAQKGEGGEEKTVKLELRLIADVGVIGYPNVGKSTLLASASAAKPKIASYPFTTLEPVLGVVEVKLKSFVMAEIPGLIEGAHLGRGLGHDFLRHVMRTKMLIHLIDGSSASPVEDMVRVNTELGLFDSALAQKPQLVAVNKMDLPRVKARLDEIKNGFGNVGTPVQCISAVTGEGIPELMAKAMKLLSQVEAAVKTAEAERRAVFRPQPGTAGFSVRKEEGAFVAVAPALERIVARVDMTSPEVLWQLKGQMNRLGVSRALEKAGIKPGDKIRCGSFEWEW